MDPISNLFDASVDEEAIVRYNKAAVEDSKKNALDANAVIREFGNDLREYEAVRDELVSSIKLRMNGDEEGAAKLHELITEAQRIGILCCSASYLRFNSLHDAAQEKASH